VSDVLARVEATRTCSLHFHEPEGTTLEATPEQTDTRTIDPEQALALFRQAIARKVRAYPSPDAQADPFRGQEQT
jgi:hypothetical protein